MTYKEISTLNLTYDELASLQITYDQLRDMSVRELIQIAQEKLEHLQPDALPEPAKKESSMIKKALYDLSIGVSRDLIVDAIQSIDRISVCKELGSILKFIAALLCQ